MERLINFKRYLLNKRKPKMDIGTIEKHLAGISSVFNQIGTLERTPVEDYINSLFDKGRSPGHLNNIIAAFRHWGDFVQENFRDIKYFDVYETNKGIMSDEEISALYNITPEQMEEYLSGLARSGSGQRKVIRVNRELFKHFTFFFFCLAHTGMRPKELVFLRATQIDFGRKVINLDSFTKTHTPRAIAISDMLLPVLQNYVKNLVGNRLFPDWNRHQWQHQFELRKRYLGIKREKVTTYSFRHSWVTNLLDNGANLLIVSEMAGWKDINRAKTYYKMTTKSKINTIKKLSLSEASLTLYDRTKQFREIAFDALGRLAKNPEEEKVMLQSLGIPVLPS